MWIILDSKMVENALDLFIFADPLLITRAGIDMRLVCNHCYVMLRWSITPENLSPIHKLWQGTYLSWLKMQAFSLCVFPFYGKTVACHWRLGCPSFFKPLVLHLQRPTWDYASSMISLYGAVKPLLYHVNLQPLKAYTDHIKTSTKSNNTKP